LQTTLCGLLQIARTLWIDQSNAALAVQDQRIVLQIPLAEPVRVQVGILERLEKVLFVQLVPRPTLSDDHMIRKESLVRVRFQSNVTNLCFGDLLRYNFEFYPVENHVSGISLAICAVAVNL
jgi:hypothetical protein